MRALSLLKGADKNGYRSIYTPASGPTSGHGHRLLKSNADYALHARHAYRGWGTRDNITMSNLQTYNGVLTRR